MTKVIAFIMSFLMTLVPYAGFASPVIDVKEDDCLFNIEMISDVHVEAGWPFRCGFIKQAFNSFKYAKRSVDAVVMAGDITNYADEASLKQYYDTIKQYDYPVITVAGNHDIGHVGDRGKSDITKYEALANVIKYYNDYSKRQLETNYYAETIGGYKFITLGDEVDGFTIEDGVEKEHTGGHWDGITMTHKQLEFLDEELKNRDQTKPVFVCCHWALDGINGEDTIWDGSGIDRDEYDIQSILEKYENVVYISGHMHGGVRCTAAGEKYNMPMAQKVNGVIYISLPSFGIVNMFGIPWSGTGAQLEIYEGKIIFRPRNYLTGKWYENAVYEFEY